MVQTILYALAIFGLLLVRTHDRADLVEKIQGLVACVLDVLQVWIGAWGILNLDLHRAQAAGSLSPEIAELPLQVQP